ncbi:MAG: MucR family transcriptional regulator [Alphaproteobacteria bacterium]|jgi:predicted transcriptional regulator
MSKDDNGVISAEKSDLLEYATGIVAAYVGRNQIPQTDLPALIKSVFDALAGVSQPLAEVPVAGELKPAVPVKKSVTDDFIICLEDGAKLKMLKRYLMTHYNMTPDEYRAKWKLPADYPMVAPNYAQARSEMAKRIGLGRLTPASGRGRKKKA